MDSEERSEEVSESATTNARWYCFEVKGKYIGKCLTTETEIRSYLPYVTIAGNLVRVFAVAR